MYIIVDTETTGFPKKMGHDKYFPLNEHIHYDSARLVQIAWKVLDENFEELYSEQYIIKRRGFSIQNSQFHGITDEMSDTKGVKLDFMFDKLYGALLDSSVIIAHNMDFDEHIILNHTYRNADPLVRERWESMEKVCTMKGLRDVLQLPAKWGTGYKYPSLQEIHQYYFKESFEGAHDASVDVDACSRCFVIAVKQGHLRC